MGLIGEGAELGLNRETLFAFFNVADNLGINIEGLRDGDDLLRYFRTYIDLHAVPHIEHLVHFLPVGARTLMDGFKQRRNGEHIVFYHTAVIVDEVEYLGLGSTSTMNHSMYLWA